MNSDLMTLRVAQLLEAYDKQPYTNEYDGFQLTIGKGVFPTDVSLATFKLGQILGNYHPEYALDMGCGCGYLALVMSRNGVPHVYAADVHPPAVTCTLENVQKNPEVPPIKVRLSNLFENFEEDIQFDLIVFNHFYRPGGTSVFGPTDDGGKAIFQRFLNDAKLRLRAGGVILATFLDLSDLDNDPKTIALESGFKVKTLLTEKNHQDLGDLLIYEISL
jgi:16S rRNA G1207 methylase RsmC